MQVQEKWKLQQNYHGQVRPVYACAIKPDHKEVLVANEGHLLVYSLKDGQILSDQKKHKKPIYAIAVSQHDNYFATAGCDDTVVVWDSKLNKGIVKFVITGAAASLSFSPVSPHLLACAGTEFSIWHPKVNQVNPVNCQAKVLCGAWAPDGKTFALGLINGTLSVRNSENTQEIYTHHLQVPVFCVCWSNDTLLAGDWDNRLTIHKPRDSMLTATETLPAQPTNIINFQSNIIVTDIAGGVTLYNDDGQLLSTITNVNEWIWSISACFDGFIALGLDNGYISLFSLGLKPVYSIYRNAFAIRTELTKVRLRVLDTDLVEDVEFVKPVQGVSVTETQIAIRFADEVSAYSYDDVNGKLELTKIQRFESKSDSKQFFSFSSNFVFILEKSVKILGASGNFIREFNFGSPITAASICSTIVGMEGIFIGLEDGQVIQIFVDHRFSHVAFKHDAPIRSVSVSQLKTKIAVVDDKKRCCVYDMMTGKLLFIEEGITAACWNELSDDLLAMSDDENLYVKAYSMQRIKTAMKGELARFSGLTVSTIINNELCQVDVPLNTAVKNLARNNEFERAYQIAVFGSTEEQWNDLADSALRQREVGIAVKAAAHAANIKLLHFIEIISTMMRDSKFTQDHLSAEVDAWTNNFDAAARTWRNLGENERAVSMYFDLRQFDKLPQFLSGDRMKKFALQQAKSFEDMNELEFAAQLYVVGGEALKAATLLNENGKIQEMLKLSKTIDHSEVQALKYIASALMKHDMGKEAAIILSQLDDVSSLALVHIIMKDWGEAIALARMHKALLPEVFLPYARHLFEDDQYFESLVSFFIAGRVDEALKSLNMLLENAITMNKYDDVAFFLYGRSLGMASVAEDPAESNAIVESGLELSHAYSAFGRLREDTTSPFTVRERGASFYLSRYVVAYMNSVRHGEFKEKYLHQLPDNLFEAISYPEALFSLLNESDTVGEYRLMRWCAEQLSNFVVPPAVQEAVDLAILRTAGMNDDDEGEICPRCSSRLFASSDGPLLWCSECKCPIVFSAYSFKVLPLVPITIKDVEIKEAKELIAQDPPIDGNVVDISEVIDPARAVDGEAKPVLNADALKNIDPSAFLTLNWKENSKVSSSFILNPDLESVHICRGCNSIFSDVDFEETFLENGACPICKTPLDNEAEGEFADTYESYSDTLKELRDFSAEVPIEF